MELKNSHDNNVKISNSKYQNPNNGVNLDSQYKKSYSTQNHIFKKTNKSNQRNEVKKSDLIKNLDVFKQNLEGIDKRNNYTPSEFAVFLLILVGHEIELKLNNGQIYRGLFQSLSTKGDLEEQFVCIQYCRRILDIFSDELSKPIEEFRIFPLSSIYRFITTNKKGIPTNFESVSGEEKGSHLERINSFKTDHEISRNFKNNYERTLQPWISEDPDTEVIEDILGEEPDNHWDQFEENLVKFGVKGTFDENLYTTPLNYNEISEEAKKNAESIAIEIENEQRDHSYCVENKLDGRSLNDSEEMHFSSVYRNFVKQDKKEMESCKNPIENQFTIGSCRSSRVEFNEKLNNEVKNVSKTNFSFNPNAKEFLPRNILKHSKINNTDPNNYVKDRSEVLVPVPGNSLYQDSNNTFYQYYRDGDTDTYQQLIYKNVGQYGNEISLNEIKDKSMSDGVHFGSNQRNETNRNFVINQYSSNSGVFVYSGSGIGALPDNVKGYSITGSTYNGIAPHAIYYLPAKSEDPQNTAYYISNEASSSHWSSYPIQNTYYHAHENSIIYHQYGTYQNQGNLYY